jgi:hypothetical protein
MTTITRSFNNTNTYTTSKKTGVSNPEKNLWCREVYWKVIESQLGFRPFKETNGCHLRSCNRESHECRGAHNASELKPFKHIKEFNRIDKATYNWSQLFFEIISNLQRDGARIKSEEHKRILSNVSTMNFFEAIRTWREMACFYRKIAKELPSQKTVKGLPTSSTGFTYSEDVPGFYIGSNLEDTAWSFERITRWCPEHQKFKRSIQSNQLITIWDICLATGLNCKEGIHEMNEKICEEDFLTGKCSCQTLELISAKQDELQDKILEASTKMQDIIKQENAAKEESSSDGFVQAKNRSKKPQQKIDPKVELIQQINQFKKKLEELLVSRLVHYSELGMVPFETQYAKWTEEREATKLAAESQPKASCKESWDHDLVDNAKITKPVVKISKLGAKK